MKSLLFLFLIAIVTLSSCTAQKSNKDKLIGKWVFVEDWEGETGDDPLSPKKSDSAYEMMNDMFRDYLKDVRFFYDGKNAGSVTVDNDTIKKYPLTFINDSTYKADYATSVIHFEGINTLIEFNPDTKEYTKFKRVN